MSEPLTGSLEDYLEAIYHLIQKDGAAHASQLAGILNVKKSSVTSALRALGQKNLIHYAPYSNVTLTPEGEKAAQDIVRRHETLKDFLVTLLGVDEGVADETACKMEHVLPKNIADRINQFMEFIVLCPRAGSDWISQFHAFCRKPQLDKPCADCAEQVREKVETQAAAGGAGQGLISLSRIEPGQKAAIVKILHKDAFRKRILEMGITVGAVVSLERVAPLGDPIDIKIRGYHLSLRKQEAQNIQVRLLA